MKPNTSNTLEAMPPEKDDDAMTNIRLPRDWLARADALVPKLDRDEEVRAVARPSRSTVLRIAVLVGIKALEKKYGAEIEAEKPKPRTKR